jgi:hypothetical protein
MARLSATDGKWREFGLWRNGLEHALGGGLWLHPFELRGEQWAHMVSADRAKLLRVGERLGMREAWLQYRPLKHPHTGRRVDAWHWDLRGARLELALRLAAPRVPAPPR